MRAFILACFLLLCVCLPAQAETKIGIVDMKAIIAKSEPGSKAMEKLKAQFTDMKKTMDAQKKNLDTLKDELQKQSMMLSQDAKLEKETQFKKKVRDFQDMGQSYQRKLQQAEADLSKPIIDKLMDIILNYGKKNGFTVILDKQASGVVYSTKEADLTQEITTELNKAMRGK